MSESPLTYGEHYLAHIAARGATDSFLIDLVMLAEDGGGFHVSLLVNGMIIAGRLGKPDDIAEELDQQRSTVFRSAEKPEEQDEQEWAAAIEALSTDATRKVAATREFRDEIEGKLEELGEDVDLRTIPAEIGHGLIQVDHRSQLTLTDARIFAPGQQGMTSVPVMRIAISQVSGWWINRLDENGDVSFTLWDPLP